MAGFKKVAGGFGALDVRIAQREAESAASA
jgi:hypothetical protein